jgi:4-amino-4-deoxy-L-arabinose transferase-like glycosyltransferase
MQRNYILIGIIFLFFIIGIAAYISGLFIDVTRDAAKYATVAKEIYQNRNLINLTVLGEPYDQKPPMLFWLSTLGFAAGTISNFWFKFPVFLLMLAGIYWAFKLGESLYGRKTGIVTAILLFSSFIYSLYSMDIHTDTPLQAFVTLALWQLYEFIKTNKTRNALIGFTAIGLAMLSKGPVGAAIPAFAVVGHILLKKDFKRLLDYRWYVGTVWAFIVASPALISLINQFGWEGIRFFFWDNLVGRVTGSYVQAVNDPIFYIHNLLYQLLPWSLLFYIAVFFEFRNLVKNRFKANEYFILTGIWIYFIILNSASSQLPNYVFSIVPLMAVLASKWIVISVQQMNRLFTLFYRTQLFVLALIWAGIFGIAVYLFPTPGTVFWIVALAGLVSTGWLLKQKTKPLIQLLIPSVIVSFTLMFLLNTHVFPYIFHYQAPPKAARYFSETASRGEKLYSYKYIQYELFFYSKPQALPLNNRDELEEVAGKVGTWIFTDETGYSEIKELELKPDSVIKYNHLDLSRGGRFINPTTRNEVLQAKYLIKF